MTVISSNEAEQAQSVETLIGPGARLRKAREAQGLDQARVAAQLHLNEVMIEAMELDDFDALPGAVFIQGYLRNYARLLGLPESEILATYQRLRPVEHREKVSTKGPKGPQKLKQEVHSSHGLVRLTTWLIILGLAALLFLWWQGRFGWQNELADEDATQQQPVEESFGQEDLLPELSPDAGMMGADDETPGLDTNLSPTTTAGDQAEPIDETIGDAESASPDAESTQVVQEEEEIPVESPVAQQSQAKPVGSGELILAFSDTCWVSVRDPSGKALLIGEKRSGFRKVIDKNLGPFDMVLGNVSGVTLTLDGKPYDLTPYTTGNVARFTLKTD